MALICDFCSEQPITWSYPARSFIAYQIGNVGGESVGGWACCEACHSLIEAGDVDGLARRSLETLLARYSEMQPVGDELLLQLKILHQSFFEHRLGAPLPLSPEPDPRAEARGGR